MPSSALPGIGSKLRSARIQRALSIEETAWRTRIRPELLRALEREEFDQIGHHAFVRSHLASYARFLGIDPAEIVDEFEEGTEDQPSSLEELDRQARDAKKPPRPKWLIAALVCGGVLAVAAVVGVLGGQSERPGAEPSGLASIPSIPASAASVTAAEARVELRVDASADTNVTVAADGTQVFDGMLAGGTSKVFRARDVIDIAAANAGTVRLTLNGTAIGAIGEPGTALHARFGPTGRLDG